MKIKSTCVLNKILVTLYLTTTKIENTFVFKPLHLEKVIELTYRADNSLAITSETNLTLQSASNEGIIIIPIGLNRFRRWSKTVPAGTLFYLEKIEVTEN